MNTKTPSRLQLRLEADIASAKTQLEADCLRAERAAYLARVGEFDEVRAELNALHERYDRRPNVEISAWVNLVEGLEIHSQRMAPDALDKFRRAHALSKAAGLVSLQALSAAWLAHMAFLSADVQTMTERLEESIVAAGESDRAALARASLVFAQGYHQGGRLDCALPWYSRARDCAVADGDEATLSALMHNMAWLRASNLRQEKLLGVSLGGGSASALLGADSTAHFDQLFGVTNLHAHVPILRAKLLASDGDAEAALQLFESYSQVAIREGMGRLEADLLADQAWCRARLGHLEKARRDAILAEAQIDPSGQPDDRAFAHSRLSQVFRLLGDETASARHEALGAIAWSSYVALQASLVSSLASLAERIEANKR